MMGGAVLRKWVPSAKFGTWQTGLAPGKIFLAPGNFQYLKKVSLAPGKFNQSAPKSHHFKPKFQNFLEEIPHTPFNWHDYPSTGSQTRYQMSHIMPFHHICSTLWLILRTKTVMIFIDHSATYLMGQPLSPASTRRVTDVVFMWISHVEITWENMWECGSIDFYSIKSILGILTWRKLSISTHFPT